ncbi:MAG TPA: thioredoxin [Thermoplasmatales archaeon]|nr:MAG: thioredoxin [Thermoplasmata archaeon]HHH79395.1 thioredoxin [Thermoplasmatales archaeon]
MDELEILRRKKLEELQQKFSKGDNVPEYPDKPIHVTDKDLDAVVSKYNLVVVDCWAEWCAPCRMIAPAIEEMAKEMKGKVVFAKLNVDENQLTAMKYQIMSIPTLMVFKNGKLVDKIIGAMPKPMLKAKLSPYL